MAVGIGHFQGVATAVVGKTGCLPSRVDDGGKVTPVVVAALGEGQEVALGIVVIAGDTAQPVDLFGDVGVSEVATPPLHCFENATIRDLSPLMFTDCDLQGSDYSCWARLPP
ncbi:MAG: hypothetical protein ABW185_11590 [Sedimenticola sp.]